MEDCIKSTPRLASGLHDPPSTAHDKLAWIQTQQLAQTLATNARPTKPFKQGTANEFALHMAKFNLIANTRGMDCRAKMLELSQWFAGAPKLIVDADTIGVDAEEAYARARRELNIFYG